jgi:predicted transport protein
MGDIKLFRTGNSDVSEIMGSAVAVEKSLQTLLEKHLQAFLGVRFLASEYATGKTHGGRIDTLGIDENDSPVIIEYKRSLNENVINQGLYYLDWLLDHRAEFKLLVLEKLGKEIADAIDWSSPRLCCIAGDFTKYDEHAVQQINRNIDLIRYRRYGSELLVLELVNTTAGDPISDDGNGSAKAQPQYKTFGDYLAQASTELRDRFESLKAFILALGDDIQAKQLKYYMAFRRLNNFASIEVHPQTQQLLVYVKVNPTSIQLEPNFTRDVTNVGHYGTGDLEIRIKSNNDLEKAKPLIVESYEVS